MGLMIQQLNPQTFRETNKTHELIWVMISREQNFLFFEVFFAVTGPVFYHWATVALLLDKSISILLRTQQYVLGSSGPFKI